MRFIVSFENAAPDAAPGDGSEVKPQAVLPTNVAATPGVAGDDLSTDTNDADIVPAVDTLLEIEKDMLADGPDEGVVDGHSTQEAAIENAVAIECGLNEIANELSENDRVIEVTEGLEDIRSIVQATPDGQTVDIPMLQTAANMAVAGTDANAQSILPAMEAFKDKEVALEALGEKIAAATASVIDSVKNMGVKVASLLKNIFSSLHRLEEGLKQREASVRAIKGNVQFAIKGSRYLQKDQNSYVTDGADFVKEFTKSAQFFTAWTDVAVKSVIAFDGSFSEWFRNLANPERGQAAAARLYKALIVEFGQSVKSLPGVAVVKGGKEVETMRTPIMLGGIVMQATIPRHVVDYVTGDKGDVRTGIQQTDVRIINDYWIHNTAVPTIDFAMSPQNLKAIIDLDRAILNSLKKYLNESYKRFKQWSNLTAGTPEIIVPNSKLLVSKATNHAFFQVGYARNYGENILRSSFIVLDKAIAASGKATSAASATPAAA